MLRRLLPLFAVILAVGGCSDNLLTPTNDVVPEFTGPSYAIMDAANGGAVPGFYFLPPLADNPTTEGLFDPNLSPSMEVCELDGDISDVLAGNAGCVMGAPYKVFQAGSASVSSGHYAFDWNTKKNNGMDPEKFYRIRILLDGAELGYMDINPQAPAPGTPGEDVDGLYAFRVGEKLPVKVFMTTAARCATAEGYVIQCTATAVLDQTGGVISLEPEETGWPKLSIVLPAGALPGYDAITVTIERIDPVLFLNLTGEPCIPYFDAPQFSDCLRVTTDPVLDQPLNLGFEAIIEMCIDPYALGLPLGQEEGLQIIRYNDEGPAPVWQGLPGAEATTCGFIPEPPPEMLGLLPVPEEDGFMRLAAIGVNKVARFLAPEALVAARGIRLAGATSNFSRFRWALPGAMQKTAGDGLVVQPGDDRDITATVLVLDGAGDPVNGATVHFGNDDDVVTGADGEASTTWTVGNAAGVETLTAEALGLRDTTIPDNDTFIPFAPVIVEFTATVVGAAGSLEVTGDPLPEDGAVVASVWEGIGATVADSRDVEITDPDIVWTQVSPDCSFTEGADPCVRTLEPLDGTITWTLGETVGVNQLIGTVPGPNPVADTITVVTVPDVPELIVMDPNLDATDVIAGSGHPTISSSVFDGFGNITGATVAWSTDGNSDYDDLTGVWTLGTTSGVSHTLTATVADYPTVSESQTVTIIPGDPAEVVMTPGDLDGTQLQAGSDPLPVAVSVLDASGNLTGADVTWSTDDNSGYDAGLWTVGTTSGVSHTLTATVSGFQDVSASQTVTIIPGDADHLDTTIDLEVGEMPLVGSSVSVSVTVLDFYDNARSDETVEWTPGLAGGSAVGDGVTDGNGYASATWTLGSVPALYTLGVEAGGLTHEFSVTAICRDGYGTASVDGSFGGAEWACADSVDFTANISGGSTDATVYSMNDGDNLYLAVRVRQGALEKVNDLRFDFDNGNGVHDENDDAIGLESSPESFLDEYLTAKCANNGQSGCGKADGGTPDGEGRVINADGWTTYELSHPLNSDNLNSRDFSVSTGDALGFFLTLRIGNGAQGNTQWPGFRDFHTITIR